MQALLVTVLVATLSVSNAKVFENCELANELRSRGVSEKQLADCKYLTTACNRTRQSKSCLPPACRVLSRRSLTTLLVFRDRQSPASAAEWVAPLS